MTDFINCNCYRLYERDFIDSRNNMNMRSVMSGTPCYIYISGQQLVHVSPIYIHNIDKQLCEQTTLLVRYLYISYKANYFW